MTDDKELIARLRGRGFGLEGFLAPLGHEDVQILRIGGDAIEALLAEREKLGREVNMARYDQPDFAWSFHKEAMADLEAKLAKAMEALERVVTAKGITDPTEYGYDSIQHARTTLAEIKGETP